ncbi:MAG: hypothetical protein QM820_10680 [Minicystis sp.]
MRAAPWLMLAIAIAGCGGQPPSVAAPPTSSDGDRAPAAPPSPPKRTLRVGLYPYVPDAAYNFELARRAFEEARPGATIEAVPLGNYYKSKEADSAMKAHADVIELDSVFMVDAIKTGRIRALPPAVAPSAAEYAPVAVAVARPEGAWFGVPRWLCGNFLYTTRDRVASFATLGAMEKAIVPAHPRGQGLLFDGKGGSTLGEMYFDAAFDANGGALAPALAMIDAATLDTAAGSDGAVKNLRRLLHLCDAGDCRSDDIHANHPDEYAKRFARKEGVAFIGYSEATHAILGQIDDCKRKGNACLAPSDIAVTALTIADGPSKPFAWVDSLAITTECESRYPECVDDAAAFIKAVTTDEHLLRLLLPHDGKPPFYLMPAKQTINDKLDAAAPMYPMFRGLIAGASPIVGEKLGDKLRTVGGKLDAWLNVP